MKKLLIIGVLVVLQFIGCSKVEYPWFSGTFDEALSSAGDKILLIDFYTDT
jgi:hypothetical protein